MADFNPVQLVARLHQLKERNHLDLNTISLNTGIDVGLLSLYYSHEKTPHDIDIKRLADFFEVSMLALEGKEPLPDKNDHFFPFQATETTWFKVSRVTVGALKKQAADLEGLIMQDEDFCLSALPVSREAFAVEASLPIATIAFEQHPVIAFVEPNMFLHPGSLVLAWERGPNILGVYYYQEQASLRVLHRRRAPSPGIIIDDSIFVFGCIAHMDIAGIFTLQN